MKIKLRRLERSDFPLLLQWLSRPHVSRWWPGEADSAQIEAKYEPRLEADSATKVFVIEYNDSPIGIIQCYRHSDYPDWERAIGIERAAGIDYLIGDPDQVGKGLGAAAIAAVSKLAFALLDVEVIVAAPQKDNVGSWKALEKAGFKRLNERKLDSDCPSDAGISYVYALYR